MMLYQVMLMAKDKIDKDKIDKDFISFSPMDNTYVIKNHNGAPMGTANSDESGYWWFNPIPGWTNYSAAQLTEIVKILEKLNEET
jgi:hypothetical protein